MADSRPSPTVAELALMLRIKRQEQLTHNDCRERCGVGCPAPVYDDHEFIDTHDDWQGEP